MATDLKGKKLLILGANPEPIASTLVGGQVLKIYTASVEEMPLTDLPVGTILEESSAKKGVFVQTGNGVLRLGDVQLPGGKVMDAKLLLNGRKLNVGDVCSQIIEAVE